MHNFFGFWDTYGNTKVDGVQEFQIMLWVKSILFFHPDSNIKLYMKKAKVPVSISEMKQLEIVDIGNDKYDIIFGGTPLHAYDRRLLQKLSKL